MACISGPRFHGGEDLIPNFPSYYYLTPQLPPASSLFTILSCSLALIPPTQYSALHHTFKMDKLSGLASKFTEKKSEGEQPSESHQSSSSGKEDYLDKGMYRLVLPEGAVH